MLPSGRTETSVDSGAAVAAVTSSALAPTATEITRLFMVVLPKVIVSGNQISLRTNSSGRAPIFLDDFKPPVRSEPPSFGGGWNGIEGGPVGHLRQDHDAALPARELIALP